MTLDELPLYATDDELSRVICGKRAGEWKQFAMLYEGKGLPKVNPILGGRYVPSVKAFLDNLEHLPPTNSLRTEPKEQPIWERSKRRA